MKVLGKTYKQKPLNINSQWVLCPEAKVYEYNKNVRERKKFQRNTERRNLRNKFFSVDFFWLPVEYSWSRIKRKNTFDYYFFANEKHVEKTQKIKEKFDVFGTERAMLMELKGNLGEKIWVRSSESRLAAQGIVRFFKYEVSENPRKKIM